MKTLRKVIVIISYAIWALKRINLPHIGDNVIYKGQKYKLVQGVANPYWELSPIKKACSHQRIRVHVSEFSLDRSLGRDLWAFKESYRFKMRYWFLIDTCNKSIFDQISKVG